MSYEENLAASMRSTTSAFLSLVSGVRAYMRRGHMLAVRRPWLAKKRKQRVVK